MNELERIYGQTDDPMAGRWFVSENHNYVRHFDRFREVIHKHNGNWTVSIGGPDNKFQVGIVTFDNTNEAKKWCDNRDQDELHHLELLIDSWR